MTYKQLLRVRAVPTNGRSKCGPNGQAWVVSYLIAIFASVYGLEEARAIVKQAMPEHL